MKKIWRCVSPILVYYGIVMVVSFICSFYIVYNMMLNLTATDMQELTEELLMKSLEASVPAFLISGLLSIWPLSHMMRKDRRQRRYIAKKGTVKPYTLIYSAAAGLLCSLAGSLIVTVSQVGQTFSGYEETTELIFSQSVIMQIASAGIVIPIAEELIFRGLIYNRLKDYISSVQTAMIASAIIFGFYHGNFIQAIYGAVMGLMLAFVYEKYQIIAAPVICHICANMISVVLSFFNVSVDSPAVAVIIAIACIAGLALVLKLIQSQVHAELTENPDYIYNDDTPSDDSPQPPKKYSVDDYYPNSKD